MHNVHYTCKFTASSWCSLMNWLVPRFARLRICNFDWLLSDFCSQFQRTANRQTLFFLSFPHLFFCKFLRFSSFPHFVSSSSFLAYALRQLAVVNPNGSNDKYFISISPQGFHWNFRILRNKIDCYVAEYILCKWIPQMKLEFVVGFFLNSLAAHMWKHVCEDDSIKYKDESIKQAIMQVCMCAKNGAMGLSGLKLGHFLHTWNIYHAYMGLIYIYSYMGLYKQKWMMVTCGIQAYEVRIGSSGVRAASFTSWLAVVLHIKGLRNLSQANNEVQSSRSTRLWDTLWIQTRLRVGASLQLAMVVDDTEFSAVKMMAWKIRGRGVN